jgi:hypothetical protein
MTIEQIQILSELTDQAAEINDIESLVKIKKILDESLLESEFSTYEGIEWFESSLTGEQMLAVNNFI